MPTDFSVEYRPGQLNTVADALSRCHDDDDAPLHALTAPFLRFFDDLRREFQDDAELCAFRDAVVTERGAPWRVTDGLVLRGDRVFVPATSASLLAVLQLAHLAGHKGIQKTLHRLQ